MQRLNQEHYEQKRAKRNKPDLFQHDATISGPIIVIIYYISFSFMLSYST